MTGIVILLFVSGENYIMGAVFLTRHPNPQLRPVIPITKVAVRSRQILQKIFYFEERISPVRVCQPVNRNLPRHLATEYQMTGKQGWVK